MTDCAVNWDITPNIINVKEVIQPHTYVVETHPPHLYTHIFDLTSAAGQMSV